MRPSCIFCKKRPLLKYSNLHLSEDRYRHENRVIKIRRICERCLTIFKAVKKDLILISSRKNTKDLIK